MSQVEIIYPRLLCYFIVSGIHSHKYRYNILQTNLGYQIKPEIKFKL